VLKNLADAKAAGTVHVIDGDLIVYRACHVAQRSQIIDSEEDGPPVEHRTLDADTVRSYVAEAVTKLRAPPGGLVIVALSDTLNFRRNLFPEYKANRTAQKPLGLEWVRYFVRNNYRVETVERLEADDVLGIYATHPDLAGKVWIFSDDKDMKTIPCRLMNMERCNAREIEPAEATYWHYYQTLIGDPVDGYKGLPGCGPKGAEKILGVLPHADPVKGWELVVSAYEAKKLSETDAVRSACMAKILLWDDVKDAWPQIRLWGPPK
jgi:DNA polymerase-1